MRASHSSHCAGLLLNKSTCGLRQTVAPTPRGDADRNSPFSRRTWPGSDLGVRAPDPEEIPLNEAEVAFGIERGLI